MGMVNEDSLPLIKDIVSIFNLKEKDVVDYILHFWLKRTL